MLSKSLLAKSLVATSVLLSGCGSGHEPDEVEVREYVDGEVKTQVQSKLAHDEVELKTQLEELKKTDPAVKDMYYSVDDKGEKSLHIVKEEEPTSSSIPSTVRAAPQVTNSVWPILGGVATGALVSQMINAGGMNRYAQSHPPASRDMYSQEDNRKKKNESSAGYSGFLFNSVHSSVASSPTLRSQVSSAYSSRSSGVFSSSSSARSGGFSSGS